MKAACAGPVACIVALLAGCAASAPPPVTETVGMGPLQLTVHAEGELKPARATPLTVPGENWASRRLVWMLPEGSVVGKGDLLARFTSDEGQLQLAQAQIDLRRNVLARAAKDDELGATQGRLAVDLSKVAVDLDIAGRYAHADVSTLARNDVLDAVQDVRFLDAKRDTLQWRQGQSMQRGKAELAVLDAQRATYDLAATQRRSDLDALELRAPNAGVMMLTADWNGDKPSLGASLNAGQEFGSLPDPSAMEAELMLPQIEAQGLAKGDVVELYPSGHPEQKIRSTINWVASAAKVRSRETPVKYLSMKATVPTAAVRGFGLVPGQSVEATIVLLHAPHALSVANVALRGDDGATFVEVRDGSAFLRRAVRLGIRGTARSQVLAGLAPGDQVLLTPEAPDGSAADGGATSGSSSPVGASP